MEGAVRTCADSFIAVDTARHDHAQRRFLCLHHTHLHRGGMRAEHPLLILREEKSILHIACRVIGWRTERGEVMPVVLYLRPLRYGESDPRKYLYHLILHDRYRMA